MSTPYPNCERLSASRDTRLKIVEFLEWLEEHGYHVCERSEGSNFDVYQRMQENFDDLFLRFIGVDKAELEEERCRMIEAVQEAVSQG